MSARLALALAALLAWPVVSARSQAVATEQGTPVGEVSPDKASADEAPLAICLQSNDPPLSLKGSEHPSGFDLALSRVIAVRLHRALRLQWFVSRDDPDADLTRDANALLSDGHCQLVAEYPLLTATLKRPYSPIAKLPPFDGAKPDDRHRWIKLGELAATQPYRSDALTIVLPSRDAARHVATLGDLEGLKLGVQIATLTDAIAMHYAGGRLIEHVVHVTETRDLFQRLQDGSLDAAFVQQRAFDAWRQRHGSDGLAASGYTHSVVINMGFVGLDADRELIKQVDLILADLQANDAFAPMAARTGLTWQAPRSPAVRSGIGLAELNGD